MDRGPDECVSDYIGSPETGSWGTLLTFSSCNPCHQYLCSELISSCAATLLSLLGAKEEGTVILQNTGNNLPVDMV